MLSSARGTGRAAARQPDGQTSPSALPPAGAGRPSRELPGDFAATTVASISAVKSAPRSRRPRGGTEMPGGMRNSSAGYALKSSGSRRSPASAPRPGSNSRSTTARPAGEKRKRRQELPRPRQQQAQRNDARKKIRDERSDGEEEYPTLRTKRAALRCCSNFLLPPPSVVGRALLAPRSRRARSNGNLS